MKPYGPGDFSLSLFLKIIDSVSLIDTELFRVSLSPGVSFGILCLSRNWSVLSKVLNLWIFIYYLFNINGVTSDNYSFISNIGVCVFSFFLGSPHWKFVNLLIFSKNQH